MAFKQGELDTNDLSPNAGILGTQIADHTIDVRNLIQSNSAIILGSGTASITVAAGTYAHGTILGTDTIAHGLGFQPAFILYVSVPLTYLIGSYLSNTPAFSYVDTGVNTVPATVAFGAINATNLTLRVANLYSSLTLGNSFTWSFTYYLLQQAANTN